MGKKPASQTSTHGTDTTNDGGDVDSLDLAGDADSDEDENEDGDEDGDETDENDDGSGEAPDMEAVLATFGDTLMDRMTSEIDRRINGAMNKRTAPKRSTQQQTKDDDKDQAPAPADVRSARLAYRESIPDHVKFLSSEEREFGNEYGRLLIQQAAVSGFDDPDTVGEEAAKAVGKKLADLRKYYSGRTKALLEKQGALIPQKKDQQTSGSGAVGDTVKGAELAKKMRERMTPTLNTK